MGSADVIRLLCKHTCSFLTYISVSMELQILIAVFGFVVTAPVDPL